MIYLGFPYGSNFGWGVLGKEVALAMASLTETRVLCPPSIDQRLDDEFDNFRLRRMLAPPAKCGANLNGAMKLDGPVIHAAVGRTLEPFVKGIAPPTALGYAVFEDTILPSGVVALAQQHYRRLATASTFCADILRRHGVADVVVLPHGVDTKLFCPRPEPRTFLQDHFLIFSGGKFELRKSQDIVIVAYKVLQDRHKDVILVNSWHNNWPKTRDTMSRSKFIRYFPPQDENHLAWVNAILHANGIDLERVITIGPRNHRLLPDLYHNTDLGIFPNRAEGGNNMILMEYLACGKPVLASFNSGHTDVLRRQNAILIESHRQVEIGVQNDLTAVWNEPSIEETIEKLEWCYQNREHLAPLACQAAIDMRVFTWNRLAQGLSELASRGD